MTLETTIAAFMEDGFENSISNNGVVNVDELKSEFVQALTNVYGDMSGGGGSPDPDIVVEFNSGNGVGGGAHSAFFDDPRVFNTIAVDNFGTVSLSNGGKYIDGIPQGTYYVRHWGSFYGTGLSKNSIYNLTAGASDQCRGNSVEATADGVSSGEGILECPAVSSTIFQHWFRTLSPGGANALGKPMASKANTHARIELWKVG